MDIGKYINSNNVNFLCRFLPSYFAANAIGDIFKSHYTEAWPSWKKNPKRNREM